MKNIITTILVLVTVNAFATVRTLNNNNPSPGQYTTFADAQNAASYYDTIYVSGSPVSYGNISTDRPLTIIGTGHHPQKQNSLVSQFGFIEASNSAPVIFIGITCSGFTSAFATSGTFEFERCSVGGFTVISGARLHVRNSSIGGINFYTTNLTSGLVCENNIITGQISAYLFNYIIHINNNVFIGIGSFANVTQTNDGTAEIHNNIFYGKTPVVLGVAQPNGAGVFTHNISYINTFPDDDGNNIVANPLFVNVPIGTTVFNTADDYHLQATSPGVLNLGNDGTERGVYGGSPLYSFSMTGEPAIPQIKTMSMPASVFSGQSIQVNFSSKTNQ